MIDKKILFIAGHEFIYNPQNGGQKCSLRNYKMLKNIFGAENVFLCMFSNYQYDNLSDNEKIFATQKNSMGMLWNTLAKRNVCNKKTFKELKMHIKHLDVDCIFVDSSTIGYIVSKLEINIPIIIFFHNIERNYAWNKFVHEGKKYFIAYWSYKKNESLAVEYANKVLLLNQRDERELCRLYGRKADYFLPITFDDEFDSNRVKENANEKITLLFVGSLFQPNVTGLVWFINEVMSKIDREKYILKVIGKNLQTKKNELERENVQVIGTVDDLAPYYYEADCVVIPIFYGDGMKVKTAEAMMYGKRILATKEALEGYVYQGVKGINRCETAIEFIEEISKLKKESITVCTEVRKNYLEYYDTSKMTQKFELYLKEILNE